MVQNNYNASKPLIRILDRKRYDVCYERLFSVGSNWIFKFITIPNGYNLRKSLFMDIDPNETPNGKIPPFFKGYVKDDNEWQIKQNQ